VQRAVASLAVSALVAICSLVLSLSWEVFSEPRPARAQATGTCPNAQLIDTFEGNGDQQTDTFNTTTNSLRVSYNVTGSDPRLPASLFIDVIDANDPNQLPVGDASQDGDRQGETFINAPAGTYFLDITFYGDGNYTITVEQCEGRNPSQGTPEAGASPVASSPPSSAPVSAPASAPTSAPVNAPARDSTLEDQNAPGPDSECPGARVVNTTSGNGDKQSPVFNITGESFRVTTTLETNSPRLLAFGVIVNKEGGRFVTSISRESPSTDSSIVNADPGRFFLDITAFSTNYVVTVEDSAGAAPEGPEGPPKRQVGPVDRPEGVIDHTPVTRLPRTGGPPYLAVGAVVLLEVALIAGRGALRR
jgi:hypothetical protein